MAIATLLVGAAQASSNASPPTQTVAGRETLSNERTLTVWARALTPAAVRANPATDARAVARLHTQTEDGFPEVYVVLAQWRAPGAALWIEVRVPMRPNGTTGWVPRSTLGRFRTVTTELVIRRRGLRLSLYRDGRRILEAPIGIGKSHTPTPAGHFWVRERFHVTGNPRYGPYAFGTSAYSVLTDWPGGGVVGIHGTDKPWLIPGRPSHGCVRVRNDDITRLARLVPVGTPIWIE